MVKFIIFFFIIVYVCNNHAFAGKHRDLTELASSLRRVLTFAEKDYVRIPKRSLLYRLNHHHMRRMGHVKKMENGDEKKLKPMHDGKPLRLSHPSEFDKDDFNGSSKGFLEGHYATVRGVLEYPFIGISAFSMTEAALYEEGKPQRWFVPIEQVFTFKNFKDYREGLALLRLWTAYDSAVLCYIPEGTRVNMHMGMVAPQQWPTNKHYTYANNYNLRLIKEWRDFLTLTSGLGKIEDPRNVYSRFNEVMIGGAFQYYIGSAEEGKLYLLEQLFNSPLKFASKVIVKRRGKSITIEKRQKKGDKKIYEGVDYKEWFGDNFVDTLEEKLGYSAWMSQDGEKLHFMDDRYDSNPLQLSKVLEDLGLLKTSEREQIESIRRELGIIEDKKEEKEEVDRVIEDERV